MINKKRDNAGFTLLELLLVITVSAGLFTAITLILDDWFKDSVDRKVAREMQQLQSAAAAYVQLNLNDFITNRFLGPGDVARINLVDLQNDGFLPTGFNNTNSLRQNLSVYARYKATGTLYGDAIEVITISDTQPLDDNRLFSIAGNGDGKLGVISNLNISGTCCNGTIQSVSGQWSIPLNDTYFGAAVFATLPVPNANGGYLAAYDIVSVNDSLSNNYLFRNSTADPNLNKMETNLNLNGNDITTAGVIVADNINVGGTATFNGIEPDTSLSKYVLAVRDNFTVTQNLNVLGGVDATKGNIIIDGEDTIGDDFTVLGTMDIQNNSTRLATDPRPIVRSVSSGSITTDNLNVAGTANFDNLDNGGSDLNTNQIITQTVSFTVDSSVNELQTVGSLNIGSLTTGGATVGIVNITNPTITLSQPIVNSRNAAIRGATSVGNNILITEEVRINNMVDCSIAGGCP